MVNKKRSKRTSDKRTPRRIRVPCDIRAKQKGGRGESAETEDAAQKEGRQEGSEPAAAEEKGSACSGGQPRSGARGLRRQRSVDDARARPGGGRLIARGFGDVVGEGSIAITFVHEALHE